MEAHMRSVFLGTLVLLASATTVLAQTVSEHDLHDFTGEEINTGYPTAAQVLQAADGKDYGLMNETGIFFALQPNGTFSEPTIVDSRSGYFFSDLIEGPDGNFYFTSTGYYAADSCSGSDCGSILSITPSGGLTVLHTFNGTTDGASPLGPLSLGADGAFYGTASQGGDTSGCITGYRVPGCGTLFRITPSGEFTVLHTFTGGADGGVPGMNMLQASDGNFYGVTSAGGTVSYGCGDTNCGVIYQLTPSGKFSVVVDLPTPVIQQYEDYQSELTEGKDGALYGIGVNTIYKIAPSTGYTLVWKNPSNTDVINSEGLFPASDGNLYGFDGGVFTLTTKGIVQPFAGVSGSAIVQAADGGFLGVSGVGGKDSDDGFIYELDDDPSLPVPVQLSLTPSTVSAGVPVEASLQVLNAFSVSMQQCYAFITGNGVITPLGKVSGAYNPQTKVYGAEVAFTPTNGGTLNFAVTCGGVESGFATLTVTGGKYATGATLTSNSPVSVGNPVTLTATVSSTQNATPMTGTVAFSSDGVGLGTVPLNNNSATINASSTGIPAGTYAVTAIYSGDANYQGSSAATNVVIIGSATAVSLSATPSTVTQGHSLTLSAAVSRTTQSGYPGGDVKFSYNGTPVGSATLKNGVATLTVTVPANTPSGMYTVTAQYSGDAGDQSSSGATTVTVIAGTSTSVSASPNPVGVDSAFTLTANVARNYGPMIPSGTITFSTGSTVLGTANLNGGVAVLEESDTGMPPGAYTVTATYSGDSTDAASIGTTSVTYQ
jgi:uncharacterized repeat protein (TIGR03803 family)